MAERGRSAGLAIDRLAAGAALVAAALTLCCGPSTPAEPAAESAPVYEDVTRAAGILHVHEKPRLDPVLENIMPWMTSVGAAAAAGDYDGDGRLDLYVTSSHKGSPNQLYRNNGDGTFTDVAAAAGVADVNDEGGVSMDCIWADLDADGHQDLYLVRWGTNRLFRNLGNGTFREVTAERFRRPDGSPGTPWANGNAAIAFDYDLDGRLDLYVGNYFRDVDLWHLKTTLIMHDDFEVARNGGRNFLYHQEPDGTFSEVAARLAVDDPGWTLAVGSADVNNDGWPDLYCANDFGPDQLFLNRRDGTFANVTDRAIGPDTKKGMNIDFGDFNNDGWLDGYVANITTARYLQEGNMLWRNNGADAEGLVRFMDVSPEAGVFDGGWGWGAKFLDYDADGDLDLFAVNGFVSAGEGDYWFDLASWTVTESGPEDSRSWPVIGNRSFSGYEPERFWRNEGDETFREVAAEVGLATDRDGRGIVVFDYDDDGDLDLYVANQGQAPQLFRNRGTAGHHWLELRLVADPQTGTNPDAVGARVTAVTDAGLQIRERDGGNGYAGHGDPRLYFGFGTVERVRLLEVRWPDGGLQYLEDVALDREITLRQDPSAYVRGSRLSVEAPRQRESQPAVAERVVPRLPEAELERLLSELEQGLRRDPANHALAKTYRQRSADHERWDRAIEFFHEIVERRPDDPAARLELSVAYVDKIPSRGGIAAIVSKGTLARKSLDQLDALLERDADSWIGYYARGMNHLHWPRALGHSASAVADFRRCVELQRDAERAGGAPYYERTWVLLGDALTKDGSYAEARKVWQDGRSRYPASRELAERLGIEGDEAQLELVESRRSLERPIDTDFSFLPRD